MTRRIFIELGLFLLPFVLFLVYRAASRELRIRDRWPLTVLAITGAAFAVVALIAEPLLAPSDKGKCFLAARYENGKTIPAQRVDCQAANAPDQDAPPPTPPPVAPRNQTLAPSGPTPESTLSAPQKIPEKTPDKPLKGAIPEIPAKVDDKGQPPPPPTPITPKPTPQPR